MRVYDPHKSTVEVRAADRRQSTKIILIISTVVVVIAFAVIWGWFSAHGGGNSMNTGI